jgi:hypothetical protein
LLGFFRAQQLRRELFALIEELSGISTGWEGCRDFLDFLVYPAAAEFLQNPLRLGS